MPPNSVFKIAFGCDILNESKLMQKKSMVIQILNKDYRLVTVLCRPTLEPKAERTFDVCSSRFFLAYILVFRKLY